MILSLEIPAKFMNKMQHFTKVYFHFEVVFAVRAYTKSSSITFALPGKNITFKL
jgi:hypothetical protein